MSYASVHFDTPPSVNKLWQPAARVGFVKTAAYKAWRNAAGAEVMAARKQGLRFTGPIDIVLVARRHNALADLDNLIKPCLDALQFGQMIENDNQVVSIIARWALASDAHNLGARDLRIEVRSSDLATCDALPRPVRIRPAAIPQVPSPGTTVAPTLLARRACQT